MKKGLSNYEYFLKVRADSYKGKWIAITKNKVVAVAKRADEAFKMAKKNIPKAKFPWPKFPDKKR